MLADVCKVLSISNAPDAAQRLDEDEKSTIAITDSGNINALRTIINESGLYSLVLTSRKPEAKRFKKSVTAEVLPAIRKTGSYTAAPAPVPLTREQQLAVALKLADETIKEMTVERGRAVAAETVQARRADGMLGRRPRKGCPVYHIGHLSANEGAAAPELVWLPNSLVDGVPGAPLPPLELIRQTQHLGALKLLIGLYGAHDLQNFLGVNFRAVRRNYSRAKIAESHGYAVWRFEPEGVQEFSNMAPARRIKWSRSCEMPQGWGPRPTVSPLVWHVMVQKNVTISSADRLPSTLLAANQIICIIRLARKQPI